MEAVEKPPLQNVEVEAVKINDVSSEASVEAVNPVQSNVCHQSNGVADSNDSDQVQTSVEENEKKEVVSSSCTTTTEPIAVTDKENNTQNIVDQPVPVSPNITQETTITTNEDPKHGVLTEIEKHDDIIKSDGENIETENVEVDGIIETASENVRFETEILIETNNDDQPSKYKIIYDADEPDHTNNLLSELGQNIELSDVLRSSDVTENAENNNCEVRQEVFNKEELLDILEGNDVEGSKTDISDSFTSDCKKFETQLALQQLSRLKHERKSRQSPKKSDKKISKKSESPREENVKKKNTLKDTQDEQVTQTKTQKEGKSSQTSSDSTVEPKKESIVSQSSQSSSDSTVEPKKESIVNALVKDWEDDEPSEGDQAKKLVEESEHLVGESEEIVKAQEATVTQTMTSNAVMSTSDELTPTLNRSDSETQPQRRLGRVIKKKVIFDPDNPDTFTKTKVPIKKENQSEKEQKEQPTPKKIKTDPTSPRSKSKSPVQSKLHWKKPQPKNLKQNKRLTEIDRLLMDEGAVNMICQLTPEAPKGHKNMKSKAEFIKKIQSSTPKGNEMKFRERKKESKFEEGDAKRIASNKERLSSSMKSPSAMEEFEAHCADDSIIYRRHSSSSYSSPCMSPRRLSDVEIITQNAQALSQITNLEEQHTNVEYGIPQASDGFMSNNAGTLATTVINKSDFLSIKEKLNSKLSQALNKRKRDSTKTEKPAKVKKVSKSTEKPAVVAEYKYVRLSIEQKLAEICIQHAGSINVEALNELKNVLQTVESNNDVSVTLLTAESGILCSGLQLKSLLDQEQGSTYAQVIAESARSLLSTLEVHSKLVCVAVDNRCSGVGLALVALSDIAVASDRACFGLTAENNAPLQLGAAALSARGLPQYLLNEMIVFERHISAAEALRGGLVSRVIWPERFLEQARAIARDIAGQPEENIMLKKQLLRFKRGGSLLADLMKERDLFVKYWTSAGGRELVRASLDPPKE